MKKVETYLLDVVDCEVEGCKLFAGVGVKVIDTGTFELYHMCRRHAAELIKRERENDVISSPIDLSTLERY